MTALRTALGWSTLGTLAVMLGTACAHPPTQVQKGAATPASATPAAVVVSYEARQGRELYVHYCQTCHGETGGGDGFNAFNLDPKPRDLSDPKFQASRTDAELEDAIRRGGAGVGLSALMPPWGHTLDARQISALAAFLRSSARTAEPAAATPSAAP
jgi:mono/diheme cytochrome c family protein